MAKVEKATEIKNAKIQFVSLVDAAANKRTFLLKKGEDGKATFSTFGRIVKTDSENHYVTGIVYSPLTEDAHGDFMTEDEITKAAYYFAKNGNKVDIQHSFEPFDGAAVVENWIAKADFKIGDEEVRKGSWLLTVEVTDADVWDKIEKGEISGFSMGGVGEYSEEDIDLDTVEKTAEKKSLLAKLAKVLGLDLVEKGAMAELYEERSKGTLFWNAFNSLEEILYKYDPITGRYLYESDENKVRECLEEFSQIITSILAGGESITKTIQAERPVEKAGKKMSGKNRETLKGIYESLGAFLKEFDDPEETEGADGETTQTGKEEKEVTKQEVEQIVAKYTETLLAKATGKEAEKLGEENEQEGTGQGGTGEKAKEKVKKSEELTPETVQQMVEAAIQKATAPPEEYVTVEQAQEMITKAVDTVLKSKGLPSNLGADIKKSAGGEEHYLHGIL